MSGHASMSDHFNRCCKHCVHDHWRGADRVCDLRPLDCDAPDQTAVAKWLTRRPSKDCPSFNDYRRKVQP